MFRTVLSRTGLLLRRAYLPNTFTATRGIARIDDPDEEEFICKYEAFFNRGDIDGWEIRKAMDDLHGMDLVPDPRIIIAALKACRRVNDYALCIRFLEAVKYKCDDKIQEFYPYILQEIRPTLEELGVDTPEKLGFDTPELALQNIYEL